ncbi:major outer sheath protein Msp [Treponema denticola]|uniref:Major surface protein n=1 Tax=Treponema denticola TaxID=158 RepID=A0A125RMB0_TREDN|nr:MSP porin [Treponema denticola]AMD40775.1 major surface protein [Treponema denticola]UTY27038.1 hypothetical protein E4N77_10530 [Treponema denticola]
MKKILSILMILVLLGGAAFAQLAVTPKGSATLSWGIDFGSGSSATVKHGFYNEQDLKLVIPFFDTEQSFAGGSADKTADVYADVQFKLTPAAGSKETKPDVDDISAQLNFYGFYITVFNKPSFDSSKAIGWKPINVSGSYIGHYWFSPEFTGWGTKIGYVKKDFMDVSIKLGSDGNWKELTSADGSSAPGTHSQYAMGLDFEMTPVKLISIEATVNAIFDKANYKTATANYGKMLNFGVGLTSEPMEGLKIKAGFDGAAVDGFAWDAGLSAVYKWVDAALYFAGKGSDHANTKDFNMNAHLAFTSKEEGDTNFVPGLAFGAVANAYYLLSEPAPNKTVPLGFKVHASYKRHLTDAMWVKPYAAFYGETNNPDGLAMAYNAGVIFSPIEKVEVKAAWEHGKLNKNKYEGGFNSEKMIATPLNNKGHNGTFVLSLKLIY